VSPPRRAAPPARRRAALGPADADGAPDEPPQQPGSGPEQQEQQGAYSYSHIHDNLERLDLNQLQTALATAIAAEDYALAAAIRDRFAALMAAEGADGARLLDWGAMGVPEWVADRVARLGLRFPTGEAAGRARLAEQRRCAGPQQQLSWARGVARGWRSPPCLHAPALPPAPSHPRPTPAPPPNPQRCSAAPRRSCCPAPTQ
jgi:hypothetical protein